MFAILTKDEKIANDKLIVYRVIPVAQVLMPRKDADGNNLSSLQNTAK
jgi:hypothetical protein